MPRIMGILNVTPDSFADGGRFNSIEKALQQAEQLIAQGADIIDVGGESTRPGAPNVSLQEELDRVIPIISALRTRCDIPISIDTRKAQVMREAISNGANMINDVNALSSEGALEAAAQLQVPVCLMHMQGEPASMQHHPQYENIVDEIIVFFQERIATCLAAGIVRDNIILDPGFGFGKTYVHNLILLRALKQFKTLQLPLLVGLSRKAWIGIATAKQDPQARVAGSIAAALIAAQNGADILRVHDVGATKEALQILQAVNEDIA